MFMKEKYDEIDAVPYKRYRKPLKWGMIVGGVMAVAIFLFVINLIFPVVNFNSPPTASVGAFTFTATIKGEFDTKQEAIAHRVSCDCQAFLVSHNDKWLVVEKVCRKNCGCITEGRTFSAPAVQLPFANAEQLTLFNTALATFNSADTIRTMQEAGKDAATIVNDINLDYYLVAKEIMLQIEAMTEMPTAFSHLFYALNMQMLALIDLMHNRASDNFNYAIDYAIVAITFAQYDLMRALAS